MLHEENAARKYVPHVAPKYISMLNAEAVTGQGYRWCRDQAYALGVPVIKAGKKRLIPCDLFFAALEKLKEEKQPEPDSEADPVDLVLASIGLVRK